MRSPLKSSAKRPPSSGGHFAVLYSGLGSLQPPETRRPTETKLVRKMNISRGAETPQSSHRHHAPPPWAPHRSASGLKDANEKDKRVRAQNRNEISQCACKPSAPSAASRHGVAEAYISNRHCMASQKTRGARVGARASMWTPPHRCSRATAAKRRVAE